MKLKYGSYDYDVKEKFLIMLQESQNFDGAEELKCWLNMWLSEKDIKKKNLIKFCIYKYSSNLKEPELKNFDCDASSEMTCLYKHTYSWLDGFRCEEKRKGKYELVSGDSHFSGDTMTSIWTVLKEYIQTQTNDSQKISFEYVIRNIDNIEISDACSRFIELGHSIGNFIPVPNGFNNGRSHLGKWDSWDLTLTQMYQWYKDNHLLKEGSEIKNINNNALCDLFGKRQDAKINCQKWLENFKDWDSFVKENYFESFVDENGVPKKFFDGHTLDNPLPKDQQFEEFFKAASECIEKRGQFIFDFLHKCKRLEESSDC